MKQCQANDYGRSDDLQEQYTAVEEAGQSQHVTMWKRIGSTNYRVSVRFSKTSAETINDKILRLIRNEAVGQ